LPLHELRVGASREAQLLMGTDLPDPAGADHGDAIGQAQRSAAHFCRAFETAYGITPNAYRRSMLELVTESAPVNAVAVRPPGRRG